MKGKDMSVAVIRDLDAMESIVDSRNDLSWEGWDVIHYRHKPTSFINPNSVFKDGKWCQATRYAPGRDGWKIPRRFVNVAG